MDPIHRQLWFRVTALDDGSSIFRIVIVLYENTVSYDDFAVTRFLMKSFKTSSIAVIKDYCRCFGFKLPSELFEKRLKKFISKRSL